ncbi:MAG TPA: 3-deoxy-7-phosphoheptulonate synthase [Eubacteriaceae bacterium]|nr:3-deoxy-7-phosphoheptulonate synthase [Eubacteriaceae bacterium]
MIIIMQAQASEREIDKIKDSIISLGCEVNEYQNQNHRILGLLGDTSKINIDLLKGNRSIDKIVYVNEPYKKVNRLFHPEDTIIKVLDKTIGKDHIAIIAGPCSVESEEQILEIGKEVKDAGASFLRGGAFKPRTSPYSFQGIGDSALDYLKKARDIIGLPIVSELMSVHMLDRFVEDVDIIQVGTRNMQNYDLLKELGRIDKPILLKRGLSATIEEFLMAAEYIMLGGNENIILCERGIRTFENYTRNTLDLSAIPIIKKKSHLPIIVDPSHATGLWWLVEPLAKAAIAVGADGIMIEVHNNPSKALCDGNQSIKTERFASLMKSLKEIARIENRIL